MKFLYATILCAALVAAVLAQDEASSLEEKKNVKRGVVGLGYGGIAPYGGLGYGYGFGHGYYPIAKSYYGGWGPYSSSLYANGYYGGYLGQRYPAYAYGAHNGYGYYSGVYGHGGYY